jgi:hypothetical protein
MKKSIFLVFITCFALLLSGCVTNPLAQLQDEHKLYVAENRPKAMGGTLTWSAYYAGALAIVERIPPNVEGRMNQISGMREALSMAKEYEAGRITKDEFYKWRDESNARVSSQNAANQKNRAQCEYESKTGAAAVLATGRSGINFDQIFKERELFDLCMKTKQ